MVCVCGGGGGGGRGIVANNLRPKDMLGPGILSVHRKVVSISLQMLIGK